MKYELQCLCPFVECLFDAFVVGSFRIYNLQNQIAVGTVGNFWRDLPLTFFSKDLSK